jgi:hypothetical protein
VEILRWILILPLLCAWLFCVAFNWGVIIQVLRNKFTGDTNRVSSMIPLMGGICLTLVANLAPSTAVHSYLPAGFGVFIWLLDPGSIPYLLFIIVLGANSVWRRIVTR